MKSLRAILVASALFVGSQWAMATEASRNEMAEAGRWASAKFEGKVRDRPDLGYILPKLKSRTIEKNTRKNYKLKIADQTFARGIHCPSIGTLEVHLPAPGKKFTARVGVDSNDIDYYSSMGRGLVKVEVNVKGGKIFESQAMREGQASVPIDVNLDGARDFTLIVSGESKGIDWNQVNFASATVTLHDGKTLWLDELPVGPIAGNYDAEAPFSFVFNGRKSSEFLKSWNVERSIRELDSQQTEHTLIYKDPKGSLEVRLVGIEYHDFPVVDWTLYFKNPSGLDSPIVEDIQALDIKLERGGNGEFTLHHNKGAPATVNDYEPYETVLAKSSVHDLSGKGGRPSNKDLPYFNLAWPDEGAIIVVGWPGQWAGQLTRDGGNGIQIRAGQELTHFKLLPGEEVRAPRIVLMFWKGEWRRSQNLWRRWMMAHNMPRRGGQLPPPQLAGNTSRQYVEMTEATDRDEIMFIDRYVEEKMKLDYFWMDAGWYTNNGSWVNTGTWEVDTKRFPTGLRAVSDHAHAKGIKIILWFEPERVTPDSWLYSNHPEWLLSTTQEPGDQLYDKSWRLFNFGDPKAREWMTNHIDKLIVEQGVDLYRQDFNMDPLNFWRAKDTPDRQGITEIRYVTGYLAYWDELRRRHPNMLIDSCASGGRRNDIETMKRAVPLTRSDYLLEAGEPISQQMQTLGMAQWIPFFGTGTAIVDPYIFRSQMTPGLITVWDLRRKDGDFDAMRGLVRQWRTVAPNYYGDFYPLTSYSLSNDVWAVMQFDRPEVGEGFIEVFRRSRSPFETARIKLQGLDSNARYVFTNLDDGDTHEVSGTELLERGVEVRLNQAPGSALLSYKRM